MWLCRYDRSSKSTFVKFRREFFFWKPTEYCIFKFNYYIFRMSVARTREGKTNKIGIVANCMEAQENRKV